MNAWREMKDRQQEEYDRFPMFAAFNNEQLAAGMARLGVPGKEHIYDIGGGCFIRRADVKEYAAMLERHHAEQLAAMAADRKGDGFIFDMFYDELENHEYSYTGEAEEAIQACGLTWEQIINSKPLLTGLKKAMKEATEGYI